MLKSYPGMCTIDFKNGEDRISKLEISCVVLAWTLGILVFFRGSVFSGFEFISGDIGDARLIIVIHEHWFRVIQGLNTFSSPMFFYPSPSVMGYTDCFFLFQIFYIPFRFLGFDQFQAFQFTLIGLTFFGFSSFYLLSRWYLNGSPLLSAFGAIIFTFSNMNFIKNNHPQLLTICFVPLVLLFLIESLTNKNSSKSWAFVLGASSGILSALIFFTSFYTGWFFILAGMLFLLAYIVFNRKHLPKGANIVAVLWAFPTSFILGLIPFVVTYLPALREGRRRTFANAIDFAGHPTDWINVGAGNWVWEPLIKALPGYPVERLANGESSLAVTPTVVLVLVAGAFFTLIERHRNGKSGAVWPGIILSCAAVFVVQSLIIVKVGNYSLWWAVWKFVPGGSAIRVPMRLQLMTSLTTVIGVVLVLSQWRASNFFGTGRWAQTAIFVGLTGVMVTEQINLSPNAHVSRSEELARLDAIPAYDKQCKVFYALYSANRLRPVWALQIDAMLIAQKIGIPTVNGYSGWDPQGWGLADIHQPGYVVEVEKWLERYGLTDEACTLDLATYKWSSHTDRHITPGPAPSVDLLRKLHLAIADIYWTRDQILMVVEIANKSDQTAHGFTDNPLRLSWRMPQRSASAEDGWVPRIDMPSDIAPGVSIRVAVALPIDAKGERLELSLVVEGLYWAHGLGVAPLRVSLNAQN